MKKFFALILCLVLVFSLAACSSSDKAATNETGSAQYFSFATDSADQEISLYSAPEEEKPAESTADKSNEKIIKTVELSVQTKEYEAYIAALTASVSAAGGYVENSKTDMGGYYNSNRYATYVVRIPADKLDSFVSSAEEKGKIVSKTEKQENVTLEYVDLESRIEAYKTEKETLTNLLEKAASLENVLAIQERLSEVNYQIESYTSQLNVLANRVSYSTVTLNINEVERVTEEKPTLWTQIKNRFFDNLDSLVDSLRSLVVGIVGGIPVILPVGILIFAAALIIKRIIKKRKSKKETN